MRLGLVLKVFFALLLSFATATDFACCVSDACTDVLTQEECTAPFAVLHSDTTCASNPCATDIQIAAEPAQPDYIDPSPSEEWSSGMIAVWYIIVAAALLAALAGVAALTGYCTKNAKY
jgi:hypothetical protein